MIRYVVRLDGAWLAKEILTPGPEHPREPKRCFAIGEARGFYCRKDADVSAADPNVAKLAPISGPKVVRVVKRSSEYRNARRVLAAAALRLVSTRMDDPAWIVAAGELRSAARHLRVLAASTKAAHSTARAEEAPNT